MSLHEIQREIEHLSKIRDERLDKIHKLFTRRFSSDHAELTADLAYRITEFFNNYTTRPTTRFWPNALKKRYGFESLEDLTLVLKQMKQYLRRKHVMILIVFNKGKKTYVDVTFSL